MKIIIKTIKGDKKETDINIDWTVDELKKHVHKVMGVEPESQKLIFKAKQLTENKILSEYQISENDAIVLLTLKVKLLESNNSSRKE